MAAPLIEPATTRKAIRVVAAFEALKGAIVLVTATGLLSLVHKDVHEVAAKLVAHAHLNPASKYPHIFLDATANLHDARLLLLAFGAFAYSIVRFVEAYGLYFARTWAEVLAAVSGAIYVPFELYELAMRPSARVALILCINVAIVAVMLYSLARRRASSESS